MQVPFFIILRLKNGEKHPFKRTSAFLGGCGERIRTNDLRVMSPTSYQLLYPAIFILLLLA